MLTIGYIGNGKSTNRYHLPYSLRVDGINVKTIYAPSDDSPWDKIEGVNYTTDINDLWNDEEIQMVVVCTPVLHFEFAKEALEHGKHVLVEKPFTDTVAQAKELYALADSKGLIVQCYQNRRFDSDFLTTQKVIESGKIGTPLELEMHFDYFRPEVPKASKGQKPIGSFLYGHACHTLDQVISYFGIPKRVTYDVRQLLGAGHMNDYFDLDLFYEAPLKVSVKSSYFRLVPRPSFIVYGTKGSFVKPTPDRQEEHLKQFYMPTNADFGIDKPEHYGTLTYMDDDGVYHEEKVISEVGDYRHMYYGMYDTIINGKPKIVKDEETLAQMEMLETGMATIIE